MANCFESRGWQIDKQNPFKPYWTGDSEYVRRGDLVQGAVRMSVFDYEESHVPHPDGGSDIILCGMANRNRALNGDIVAVHLYPEEEWIVNKDNLEGYAEGLEYGQREGDENLSILEGGAGTDRTLMTKYTSVKEMLKSGDCTPFARGFLLGMMSQETVLSTAVLQRTGTVVEIIERKHTRICAGHLKPMRDSNKALFLPTDRRLPRLKVNMDDGPQGFLQHPGDYEKILFMACITDWPEFSSTANGCLGRKLGLSGEIETKIKVLMIENNVDNREFSKQVTSSLHQWLPWTIPQEELEKRRDLSELCIFTMDSQDTLDLDNAISFKPLGNDLYEVGVHIADVSYFVPENSDLDNDAAARATCVHLVNNHVPMLPQILREDLCSLNPGIPRLAFSVIWTLSETGEIIDEWAGQAIARSCCKLTFEQVQALIDKPGKAWTKQEFPPITNGFSVNDIKQAVLSLNMIAKSLRQRRFASGALHWQTVRLQDALDSETGLPTGYTAFQSADGNDMVEEFRLLANIAVAKIIKTAFPRHALLQRRPCPRPNMLTDMENLCTKLGIPMNTSSSAAIHESLVSFSKSDLWSNARHQVVVDFVSRCNQRPQYVCTATNDDEAFYQHYRLNVPIFTHFTSPIHIYSDIMVQRILSAALEGSVAPSMCAIEIQRRADHCNEKRAAAWRVTNLGYKAYFAKFIWDKGGIEEEAIVSSVFDQSFYILIPKFGVSWRVYCDKIRLEVRDFRKQNDVPILTVIKSGVAHEITIFTMVKAVLKTTPGSFQWYISAIHF